MERMSWRCVTCDQPVPDRGGWLWLDQDDIRKERKPYRWHVQYDRCRAPDRERVGATREYELFQVRTWQQILGLRSQLSRLSWFANCDWDAVVGLARTSHPT